MADENNDQVLYKNFWPQITSNDNYILKNFSLHDHVFEIKTAK